MSLSSFEEDLKYHSKPYFKQKQAPDMNHFLCFISYLKNIPHIKEFKFPDGNQTLTD
jgi:hypothetical protein